MIYLSTSRQRSGKEDRYIYFNGNTHYLHLTFIDGNGASLTFRVCLPKLLPLKYLRATRDGILDLVEKNALRWEMPDLEKLQLNARKALRKLADEHLEAARMEKLGEKYCKGAE